MLVPLSGLFTEARAATPEYRRGYERIFGKKARARREKEQEQKKKEQQKKVKKEKEAAAKERQKDKKEAAKQKQQKVKALKKEKTARQTKAAERRAVIKKKGQPPKPPGLSQIPAQVAHCMMAVHVKRGKSKEAAWNICRWSLSKHGYLKGPYRKNAKLPKTVKQTQKGVRRSFQHGMEKGPLGGGLPGTGISKYNRFIKMFKDMENNFLLKKDRT